jgi:acetoin utilization deacetylase AcuC-like enzyme
MLYLSHPSSLAHDPRAFMPEHPDIPERLEAIEAAMDAAGWLGCERRPAPQALERELTLVHRPSVVHTIRDLCLGGGGEIDADTYVGETSFVAALHAAGGAAALARALVTGEAGTGFCAVRPSGHHAEPDRAMGFCLFNNVAVAAAVAIDQLGLERVMILDWDVHHGNGTAEAFRHRRDVLFASIHQSGLYPGTGSLSDVGSGEGYGYTVNVPVPAGSEEEVWLSVLEHVIVPVGLEYRPQLVLISAGFDAHRDDPLGGCRLESESFARMACLVRDLAAEVGAPIGAVLEGGYDTTALAESVLLTIRALGGEGEADSIAPESIITPRAAAHVGHHWAL